MKREFLVTKCKDLHDYLQKISLTCKLYTYKDKKSYMYDFKDYTYVLEEYKKPILGLNILVLISEEKIILDKKIKKLKEITKDKKYSKKNLELLGNPTNYDFDVRDVFTKCDSIGLSRMDLHFIPGMNTIKVFRVLMYRLNLIFALQYSEYLKKNIDYEELQETHDNLNSVLELSKKVFYKRVIKNLISDFENLYMLLNHQDTYERYCLNFEIFIQEKSFYNNHKADKAIYFFEEKEKLFKLSQNTQKEKNLEN